MDNYLTALIADELTVHPAVLIGTWALLFVATHWVVRAANAALRSQPFVVAADERALTRAMEPKQMLGQLLFAAVMFVAAIWVGGPFYAFFGGGLVVAATIGLGLNYHSLMFARTLGRKGSAEGRVAFSTAFSFSSSGHHLLGGALACVVLGLVLTNLPLLGGALILGPTGVGYLRQAHP